MQSDDSGLTAPGFDTVRPACERLDIPASLFWSPALEQIHIETGQGWQSTRANDVGTNGHNGRTAAQAL